ncbi:hypothetical protein, partial [Vibrio alginolyticus]|uniref:hypothetical protein n=1 Tax=Vibrio alginolyticus TaxID=663 RepID=UPI001C70E44E
PAMTGKYKHAYLYRENHNSHIKVTVPRNYKHSNPQFLIEQGGSNSDKTRRSTGGNSNIAFNEAMYFRVEAASFTGR